MGGLFGYSSVNSTMSLNVPETNTRNKGGQLTQVCVCVSDEECRSIIGAVTFNDLSITLSSYK